MSTEVLSKVEKGTLQAYEAVIEKGLASFVEVGTALMRIRDARLYRETHGTFEDYCQAKWGMSRQRAHQIIEASAVTERVSKIFDKAPSTESHAAKLAQLDDPKEQVAAWKEAVKTAPKDDDGEPIITAKHVENVVREYLDEQPEVTLPYHDEHKPKLKYKNKRSPIFKEIEELLNRAEAFFSKSCQECDEAGAFLDALTEAKNRFVYYIRTVEV